METNIIATVLFSLELYHVITHCLILFRVRMLPRKDLAKARYYFLVDTFTVFATCFLFTGALRWLATLQIIQHLFYFCFWENNEHVKKVDLGASCHCSIVLYCMFIDGALRAKSHSYKIIIRKNITVTYSKLYVK